MAPLVAVRGVGQQQLALALGSIIEGAGQAALSPCRFWRGELVGRVWGFQVGPPGAWLQGIFP
eukprot:11169184-Lingulodinium_polyedra.AAC.1